MTRGVGRTENSSLHDTPEPDRVELAVRFGCGAMLGLFFGVFVALYTALATRLAFFALLGLFAVVFGVLAVRLGDRFWYGLRHLKWFWP